MSKSEFKDIQGYEGYYKVNRNGDIYNIKNNRKLKHHLKKGW